MDLMSQIKIDVSSGKSSVTTSVEFVKFRLLSVLQLSFFTVQKCRSTFQ